MVCEEEIEINTTSPEITTDTITVSSTSIDLLPDNVSVNVVDGESVIVNVSDGESVTVENIATSNPTSFINLTDTFSSYSNLGGKILSVKSTEDGIEAIDLDEISGLNWQNSVISKVISTPPLSPTLGDRYIVAANPTSVWTNHVNDITQFDGTTWVFTTPEINYSLLITSESKWYVWNGSSWIYFGDTDGSIVDSSGINIGTPTDGSWSDGLNDYQSTDKVVNVLDDFNETFADTVPDNALTLNGYSLVLSSPTNYTGYLSGGNINYKSGNPSGTNQSYIFKNTPIILVGPNQSTTFNYADEGIINLVLNGVNVDTFNLGSNFNETYRNTNQVYTPKNSVNGYFTITSVGKYNNLRKWQKGNLQINLISSILRKGYNSVSISHVRTSETQTTNTYDIFYDNDVGANPQINTPSFVEYELHSSKYLSGLRYYSIGDKFLFSITGQNLFNNVYHNQPISYSGFMGLSSGSISVTDISVSGLSNPPSIGENMVITNKVLTLNTLNEISTNARITCVPRDPYGSYNSTTSNPIGNLVNTYPSGSSGRSNDLTEYFSDEYYRLPLNYNFENIEDDYLGQWNSQTSLSNGNAQCFIYNSQTALVYPTINFSIGYKPTQSINYSTFTGNQKYARTFITTEGKTNGVINVVGASSGFSELGSGDINLELKLPGQTAWLDCIKFFSSGTGVSSDGDGCLSGSISYSGSSVNIPVTFGGRTTNDTNQRIYIRITLRNSNRVINSISFS